MRYLPFFFSLVISVCSFGQSRCQTLIGIVGGANLAVDHFAPTETTRETTARVGTQIGLLLAQRLGDRVILGMEPTLMQRHLRYDPYRAATASMRLTTFRFPVLLELRSTPSDSRVFAALQLGAAASFGLRLERLEDGEYTSLRTPTPDLPEYYNLIDAGLQYGVKIGYDAGGVELYLRALRYNGFVDLAKDIRSRTSGLQLSVGATYRYARRR